MPPRSPTLLGSAGQIGAALPVVLALLLLVTASALLAAPRREAEALGRDQADRIAAELAGRAEAMVQAAALFAGQLEGSLPRRVADLVAQANRRAALAGEAAILVSARAPTGQWLGPARDLAARPDAGPAFLHEAEALLLAAGQQPGPGGAWTIVVARPWQGLARGLPEGARVALLEEAEILEAGGPRAAAGPVAEGRGEGPLSGGDAFVAVAPIPGTRARAVAELPVAPLLAGLERQHRAILFGAVALAALLMLALLSLLALLRRNEAAAIRRIEEREAEQEGRSLREMNRFFAGLPAAVWRGEIFTDGTVLIGFMSEGVERLTGLVVEQASEPGLWRGQLDAEGLAAVEDFHHRLLREGEALVEYAFVRRDGTRIWLRERARITGIGAHEGAEVAGVITDITSERQLGESAVMSSKLATLGKMAASIAHELSQPLGAITLAGETALASLPEAGTAAARARVTRINEQAERARTLIEHLRAFGRADAGQIEPVSLKAAMDGAMLLAGPLLQTAGVELVLAIPDDLPMLRARPVLLEQVLVNLFVNARDALARQPDGERHLAVRAAAMEGKTVTLTIEDSGTGFPDGVLEHVFEPFFTTKPVGQGTGLGLSICRSIVTAFGGTIDARNTGRGAEFTLVFRVWQEEAAEEAQGEARGETSSWAASA